MDFELLGKCTQFSLCRAAVILYHRKATDSRTLFEFRNNIANLMTINNQCDFYKISFSFQPASIKMACTPISTLVFILAGIAWLLLLSGIVIDGMHRVTDALEDTTAFGLLELYYGEYKNCPKEQLLT